MTDNPTSLNRNHFRAPVIAKTKAVLIEEGKQIYVRKPIDIKGIGDIVSGSENQVGPALSSLVTVLHHIDEKLDRILERLEEKEKGVRDVDVLETVDISGSGISLVLAESLQKGDMLKLSVALPGFQFGRFEALGRVVRVSESSERGSTEYKVGIEFVGLGDDEKDRLVQFTFSQQRRQIRESGNGEK